MELFLLESVDVPKTHYHYTSLEALVAIVQTKRLRASDIRFLNDNLEALSLKQHPIPILTKLRDVLPEIDIISKALRELKEEFLESHFVASFTEKSDDLSQWRAYCPPGVGVCIGFASNNLNTPWIGNPSGNAPYFMQSMLKRVQYMSTEQEGSLEKTIIEILQSDLKSTEQGTGGTMLPALLAILSPFVKHHSFKDEAEWRNVISKRTSAMQGQQFRQGKSTLIPFVDLLLDYPVQSEPTKPYFINEVIVGPTPTPELTIEALRALFYTQGHADVVIKESSIPYKSW